MGRVLGAVVGIALAGAQAACVRAPSPLAPTLAGSIGAPHRGVLTDAAELPRDGDGFRWLRDDDRHWATPRFAAALARAAATVAHERPGATLFVGDLSRRRGGVLLPHLSHRTGRDADLLFYLTTLDGAPVDSPGFAHVGPDGLAWDEHHQRYLRFDVAREWLLVKALVEDDDARVQWIFAHRNVQALLVEWARARGEPPDTILKAITVMLQPSPGGPHDDHLHVRTACAADEIAHGCEPTGPARAWLAPTPHGADDGNDDGNGDGDGDDGDGDDDASIALALLRPLDATPAANATPAAATAAASDATHVPSTAAP